MSAAHDLLRRLRGWDMLDATADGPYWRAEIDKVLALSASGAGVDCQESIRTLIGEWSEAAKRLRLNAEEMHMSDIDGAMNLGAADAYDICREALLACVGVPPPPQAEPK